jgi:hypothetical protein
LSSAASQTGSLAERGSGVSSARGERAGWWIFGFCFAAVSGDSSLRLRVIGGVVAICGDETVARAVCMTEESESQCGEGQP